MENAWMGSIAISLKKAYTSRAFDLETKGLTKQSQSGASSSAFTLQTMEES
jgi:uncharacterized protein GlcG (DUF336 family)